MARVKIPFLGVTTQSNHRDGECRAIVNMRPKNGVQKPVAPRKVVQTITDNYDIVFVHRGNDYENWIAVKNITDPAGDYAMIYSDILLKNSPYPSHVGNPTSKVNSIQQIGNTLSFVSSDNIYYAIFLDGAYKYLGSIPEIPPIKMGVNTTDCYDKLYYKNVLGSLWMNADLPKKEIHSAVVNKARQRIIDGQSTSGVASGIKLFDAHIIRYAFRLYDGSVTKHSPPILLMPGLDILSMNRYLVSYLVRNASVVEYDNSYILVHGYDFSIEYDFSSISAWNDIIKSVDIFISPALGLTNSDYFRDNFNTGTVEINLIDALVQKQIDNVLNNSLFYHSHTIDLTQGVQSFCGAISKSITNVENIIYQELMVDDSFSHHQYGAGGSSSLNNRLRLSVITTKLFSGYSPKFFEWWSDYNGQSRSSIYESTYIIHVHIKTSEGTSILETRSDSSFFYNSYIAYPDPRAYKINIYTRTGIGPYMLIFTANLQSHPSLNISYVVSGNLKPFIRFTNAVDSGYSFNYGKLYFIEYNKLKISEVNNPFLFTNLNTYIVGSGKILAESSIIMNVSDRNYGVESVFAFTTDGVYTMREPTSTAVHETVQPPTYIEPPISSVVCPSPYGVLFITQRGLMIINQYKTEFISPQLREDDDELVIDTTGITNPIIGYPTKPFTEYLQGVELMIYNPYNDEVIIVDRDSEYNYVYDFPSKTFYLSTERVNKAVQNVFPKMLVIGANNELKDFRESVGKPTQIAIVTRPIEFGIADVKKLERVFLRGILRNVNNASLTDKMIVVVFHSLDGVNFAPTIGLQLNQNGSYKDFDMGLFARSKRRSYLFMVAGTMDDDSDVKYVEFETDKEYDSEKMR